MIHTNLILSDHPNRWTLLDHVSPFEGAFKLLPPCSCQLLGFCTTKFPPLRSQIVKINTPYGLRCNPTIYSHSPFMGMEEQFLDQDSDFEFGCITPDSPTSDPNKDSPADVLFFNGRLLPHAFPSQSRKSISLDHSASRTSSIGSKDSLMSSRSNSRSSSSSARTSVSDYSDKKPWNSDSNVAAKITITRAKSLRAKSARLQQCPSGQRWQFIVPTPCLASPSERKRDKPVVQQELRLKKQVIKKNSEGSSFSQRLFKSFVLGCRKCHALEPSVVQDE